MKALKNCSMDAPYMRFGNLVYRNSGGKTYAIECPVYPKISRSGKFMRPKNKLTLEVDLKYTPNLPDPTWFQVLIINAKIEASPKKKAG
jgi:hypothetical protein